MTVRGDTLIDKENAGAALLDAMKEVILEYQKEIYQGQNEILTRLSKLH